MLSKDNYLKKFGTQIREARIDQNLSQEELAAEVKVHRNYIGRLERGEACPSIYIAYKISTILEVDLL